MIGQVYEWLAVFTTLDEDGDEKSSEIVGSGRLLAKSRDVALFAAARAIDPKYAATPEQVEMIVLPVTEQRRPLNQMPYVLNANNSTVSATRTAGWTNLSQLQGSLT